jgi:molecular chaperone Hsp33
MGVWPDVSAKGTHEGGEIKVDQLLGFTLADRHARGRIVRLGPVLDEILVAHDYPGVIQNLLAEALVLTALMGSLLKHDGAQFTLQAHATGGLVDLLACDFRQGELRGYIRYDSNRLHGIGANPLLTTTFGEGYLVITFEAGQRYQGIVALEGTSLSEACEAYFAQSEQVPTVIRTGVRNDENGCIAGGLLVQHLPEGEVGRARIHARTERHEWDHVAVHAATTRYQELVDPDLSLQSLVWRLFHEEEHVRVEPLAKLTRGCRCTLQHYEAVLARFPLIDRVEMRGDDGLISVNCEFCSKAFKIDA